jgi:hypothetical protein
MRTEHVYVLVMVFASMFRSIESKVSYFKARGGNLVDDEKVRILYFVALTFTYWGCS